MTVCGQVANARGMDGQCKFLGDSWKFFAEPSAFVQQSPMPLAVSASMKAGCPE